ncbi:MAG TPA: CDP-alcohol phosphatidyltransferase family protein [Bacillota bacterium]|nr:CDP-alcohol phosphatidyltransferase family protein [Bacillota bacterium]HOK68914.1 CDP-alcohol phosphatidyltransferase family protein [Bacillota bacterium]HPP84719.1 CDP-alcohol phosphatidyltransferase family protein [Bacillota bacterium]
MGYFKMFIGYFSLANTITLLGLASSVVAIFCSSQKMYPLAVVMLLIAGLCDMFDGRIARVAASRAKREKIYGVQLDSLADVISFGVVPALIAYNMGYRDVLDLILYIFFIVCGAIRLAYFNTQALSDTPDLNMKYFTGVPIPVSCVLLPFLILISMLIDNLAVTSWIFRIFFLLLGVAYILKIRIRKFGLKTLATAAVFDIACLIAIALLNSK